MNMHAYAAAKRSRIYTGPNPCRACHGIGNFPLELTALGRMCCSQVVGGAIRVAQSLVKSSTLSQHRRFSALLDAQLGLYPNVHTMSQAAPIGPHASLYIIPARQAKDILVSVDTTRVLFFFLRRAILITTHSQPVPGGPLPYHIYETFCMVCACVCPPRTSNG
jgi:hypothetical protein